METVQPQDAEETMTATTTTTDEDGASHEDEDATDADEKAAQRRSSLAMELNVAFEALEMMRNVNLQVEFGESISPSQCTPCLRESRQNPDETPRQRRLRAFRGGKAVPCLACASSVCALHRSRAFNSENITICTECSHLFSPEAILQTIVEETVTEEDRKKQHNFLLEVYDRTLLILKYSIQYIDEICEALEINTRRNNQIGLGSSGVGVLSGVMGVTAACTIFTPVGPPLLLASVLFSGSATAAAAGSEAVNYRCEPNKMADKIIALHAIITSISRVPATFEIMKSAKEEEEEKLEEKEDTEHDKANNGNSGNSRYLHLSRVGMNALKPLTAGALSAVSIVTEGREMRRTIGKIRAGNPCDKVETLRSIKEEVQVLAPTNEIGHQLTTIIDSLQSTETSN